ncbi:MAG TPA: hypothetical protein VK645_18195 [Chitinophagaceae bacterium]|nr:hypothetical protein [Chitinophagaceae bacterium]
MRGSWNIYPVTDGYYDGHGRYKEGYHSVFSLVLYESSNSNPAANWIFDDNDYNGGAVSKLFIQRPITPVRTAFVREQAW